MKEKTCEMTSAKLTQGGRELATESWERYVPCMQSHFIAHFSLDQ